MKKIFDFIDKWGSLIIMALLVIVLCKGCGNNKKVRRLEKEQKAVAEKIDSLNAKTLGKSDVIYLIKTTSASQTLIDEELVDKKQLTLTDLYKDVNTAK